MSRPSTGLALALWAVAGFALFAALGASVSTHAPAGIDREAIVFRGVDVPAATFFTTLGYWPALAVFSLVAIAGALVARRRVALLVALVASHALSQTVLAGVKLLFHRARPAYWLVTKESDTSYPSGHAATVMTFYVALMLLALHVPLPRVTRVVALAALGCCAIGVPWSRLALGAHYPTDLLGGLLFGAAWLAASLASALRVTGGRAPSRAAASAAR